MRTPQEERNYFWSLKALGKEIANMRNMPDHKIGRPASPYSIAILKCASILKGAGREIVPEQCFENIRSATEHLHVPEREARRMFKRAMKVASPRYPANDSNRRENVTQGSRVG